MTSRRISAANIQRREIFHSRRHVCILLLAGVILVFPGIFLAAIAEPIEATLRDRQGNIILLRPATNQATIHLHGKLAPNTDVLSYPMVSDSSQTPLTSEQDRVTDHAQVKQELLPKSKREIAQKAIESEELSKANALPGQALDLELSASERARMLIRHAGTLMEHNQPELALKAYQQADQLAPSLSRLNYARLLSELGQNTVALDLLTDPASVKLLNPAERFHLLGILHQRANHFEIAENYLMQALKLQGNKSNWHYELGMIYELDNKTDLAQEQYIEALKLKPDSQATLAALERIGLTRK